MEAEAQRGLPRTTKQRKAIFSTLQGNSTHPTAEEVYRQVKRRLPHVSLATVYRNLKLLVQEGLIREIVVPDGPTRYDYQTEAHYHFCCDRCGRVSDVEVPVQTHLNCELTRQGYLVRSHEMVFYGLCRTCQLIASSRA
jgi:Fur family peroxide stress response transcriptional regulator